MEDLETALKHIATSIIKDITVSMNLRFDEIDARFEAIDARFVAIDARFDEMNFKFGEINQRFSYIETRMEAGFKAIDARFIDLESRLETRFEAIDIRFEAMDIRFEAIDIRFDEMDIRFDEMDIRITHLAATTKSSIEDLGEAITILGNHIGTESSTVNKRLKDVEKRWPRLTQKEYRDIRKKVAKSVKWAELVGDKTNVTFTL